MNNHLGGHTETFSRLDFQGTPLETQTKHTRDTNPLVVTVVDEFEYLHNGKLKKHIQKVNNNPKELIVANTYDELGQLISKQVGGQDVQNEIGYQKIDYRYNIRGWLTHINDIEDLRENGALNDDLFAFKINYNEITEVENGDMNLVATSFNNTVKPLFNGNIAETYWKTGTDDILRKYSYSYDDLNRLKKAYFQKPYDVVPYTQSFDEYLDYDKNGNILQLNRYADHNEYGNVIEIDALSYSYAQNSNRLMKVTDATNFGAGFQDDGEDGDDSPDQNDDYAYDNNGNMISDENKGIVRITYNHLNLPTSIRFVNGEIRYLYTAAGVKVGKTVYQGSQAPVVTDYLGGFQYVKNELQFFPHPEGYVSVVKFGPDNLVINYAYQYKDHLGNIRLNYGKDPETNVLKVLEENHYYPFGLKHQNYNTGRKQYGKKEDEITTLQFPGLVLPTEEKPMVYKYKYNGKELQDELGLNVYDYDNRIYDQAIGRFWQMDPLAEQGRRWSPYNYCFNSPIYFQDPDGMWPDFPGYVKSAFKSMGNTISNKYNEVKKSIGNTVDNVKKSVSNVVKKVKDFEFGGYAFTTDKGSSKGDQSILRKGDRKTEMVNGSGAETAGNIYRPGPGNDSKLENVANALDKTSDAVELARDNSNKNGSVSETNTPEQSEIVTVKKETYSVTDYPNNSSRIHKSEKDTTVNVDDKEKINKMNALSKKKAEQELLLKGN